MPLGDRSDSPPWDVAQKLDNHLGKMIRIAPDGTVPRDNPFVGKPGVLPEIWAYGMRSPEGLAYDPRTGRLWQNDHGPRGGDELNIVEKGKDYGWPTVARGIDYPGDPIGVTRKDGMEEPIYFWDPVIGPSGLAFYTGNLFPQWKNSMFVGGLRGEMLVRLEIANDKVVAEEPLADGSRPDSGRARRARWRRVCVHRQRHANDELRHTADQQAVEADTEIRHPRHECLRRRSRRHDDSDPARRRGRRQRPARAVERAEFRLDRDYDGMGRRGRRSRSTPSAASAARISIRRSPSRSRRSAASRGRTCRDMSRHR